MVSLSFLLSLVQSLLGEKPRFDPLHLARQLSYVAGLILLPGKKTTRRMERLMPWMPSDRFGISRTLKDDNLRARQLLRLLGRKQLVRALERKKRRRLFLIVDTTNLRRFGPHIDGVFKFKDNSTNGYILGHRVVVCIGLVGKTIVPLGTRLFVREEDAPKIGVEYKSQIDLAQELIEEVMVPPGVPVTVLADAFFFCKQIVKACRSRGYDFISRAKSNQKVSGPGQGRSGAIGKKMKKAFEQRRAKPVTAKVRARERTFLVVQRIHRFRGMDEINTVYSRERKAGSAKVIALVATDLTLTAKQVIELTGLRWAIELFFRSCKQDLGMGHYQGRHWEGVDQHLQLVLVAHLLLSLAGSQAQPASGKPDKGATLSGLEHLRTGRAQLRTAFVDDLFGRSRTRKGAQQAIIDRIEMTLGT